MNHANFLLPVYPRHSRHPRFILCAPLRLCVKYSTGCPAIDLSLGNSLLCCLLFTLPLSAADPLPDLHALGARLATNPAGQVTGIDLASARLTDPDLEKLAALPDLESINLAYTKISDEGLERLAPLKNVKNLDLYYAEFVTDLGIAHLKHWKNLER